jgi:hypothetical protein
LRLDDIDWPHHPEHEVPEDPARAHARDDGRRADFPSPRRSAMPSWTTSPGGVHGRMPSRCS